MRIASATICIALAGCTAPQSPPGICDAPSAISELKPLLSALGRDANYEAQVEILDAVPAEDRDVCWYVSTGYALRDSWHLPRAERELMTGMQQFPDSFDIPVVLTLVYADMGRFAEAEALALDALDDDPPPDDALWLRDAVAWTYLEMGDYQAAKDAWDENLETAPDDVSFLLNSMSVEGLLGHLDEARERAHRAFRNGVSAYGGNVGRLYLSFAAHFGGEQTEAEERLDQLLSAPAPRFSISTAVLATVLDHRVQDAHDGIETRHRGTLPSPLRAADAGLQALLGNDGPLDELMQGWETTEPRIRLILTRALLATEDPRAVDVARSLVDSAPGNPLYEHLLGRALRNAGDPAWEAHAREAASACPDNVLFQRAAAADP